jgi:amidase
MEAITSLSAVALAAAIRTRAVSSHEVVEAHLQRIAVVNGRLNAVVQLRADEARAEARAADEALARGDAVGPLHGVPITIKDAFEVAGLTASGGTLGRAQYVPQTDATAVARLRTAGAIVLGKTNVPELSLAFETDNLIYGRTTNPYDESRTPGGSSGGEAAIIAAGGSPLGLGTDAAGSIRWPAHCCGIAGLKPTRGRVPLTGTFPPAAGLLRDFWHAGPLARRVEDLALALRLIAGPDDADPGAVPAPLKEPSSVAIDGLRLALYTDDGIVPADAATAAAVRSAARALEDAGAAIEEVRPTGAEQCFEVAIGLFAADGGTAVGAALQMAGTTAPSPLLQAFGAATAPLTLPATADLSLLLLRLDGLRHELAGFMRRYDAIICPVNADPALPHGEAFAHATAFGYTALYNLTGWPAVVVRAGTSPEGLPIGVQIVARPWREDVALALAAQIEDALGGWQPPL